MLTVLLSCRCAKSSPSGCEDDGEEQTCLHWAYERGHDEIITLLKHFRRPETETRQGDYTPSGERGALEEGCHYTLAQGAKARMSLCHLRWARFAALPRRRLMCCTWGPIFRTNTTCSWQTFSAWSPSGPGHSVRCSKGSTRRKLWRWKDTGPKRGSWSQKWKCFAEKYLY